ncbi:MAG TPA: HEAT repeat domain-containing protein [Longimicrobiaceae bacterium]|nr:HEAT repeat domain-containing protein [Longimicrobiaceae bacterium]
MRILACAVFTVLGLWPLTPAGAQELARRVDAAPDGEVRMTFASRGGICQWDDGTQERSRVREHAGSSWRSACVGGPVWVILVRRDGRVVQVKRGVGYELPEASGPITDMGRVGAVQAAEYLLDLAEHSGDGNVGRLAIHTAVLADSATVWPALLRIARSEGAPRAARRNAVFWLGQMASRLVREELSTLARDRDREVAGEAVFALSRRLTRENVSELLEIAREHPDPEIRSKALFWLGYSSDPRVLDLYRELLASR